MHLDDGAGIEVLLGGLSCLHAYALLDRAAGNQVQGNFLLHCFSSVTEIYEFLSCSSHDALIAGALTRAAGS
jgi:hypothetical protein